MNLETAAGESNLVRADLALKSGDFRTAELILRQALRERPNDIAAIQMLGQVAAAAGILSEAERLFRHALSLSPAFEYGRLHLANTLASQGRPSEALTELRKISGEILAFDGFKILLADLLSQVGECDEAIEIYSGIVEADPSRTECLSRLAFLLNVVGRREDAIEVCRSALRDSAANGWAWWALANHNSYRFSDREIVTMESVVADPALANDDRLRLHFALGKGLEGRKRFQASFDHYRRGNELRAAQVKFSPEACHTLVDRVRTTMTAAFLNSRAGQGDPSPDPIFVVGLPRAGSTLVEQILASHPLIEGTAELTDLHALAISLQPDARSGPRSILYLDRLKELPDSQLRELGKTYIERTRIQRKTDRPFFIDKLPSNWAHVGFIKLILPNAKIIDVRRHPLACGFSNFKHLFGVGQEFSYDLANIGVYYRSYVEAMAHFDAVLPGVVHRVIHERLVNDPEGEIRRLLEFVGLPFDTACLRFHENERTVRTPSSEQVRQPIRSDYVVHWKAFEAELAPLRDSLGPALDHWDDPQPL